MSDRIVKLDPRALGLKPSNIVWNGTRTRIRRFVARVALAIIAVSVLLANIVPGWEFMFNGFLVSAVLGIVCLLIRPNRLKKQDMSPVESSPLVEMFAARREIKRFRGRIMSVANWAMRRVIKRTLPTCKEAGCIAIVERSLFEEIRQVDRHEGLLEEEPIIHGSPRGLTLDTVITGLFALLGLGLLGRDIFFGMPSFTTFLGHLALAVFMGFWAIAGRYKRWALQYKAPRLAGPGWIRSTKWRRRNWTVEDSIIYVHRIHNDFRHVIVRVIGSRGTVKFEFDSVEDEGFVDLWQRWTSSEPRLELIEESASS